MNSNDISHEKNVESHLKFEHNSIFITEGSTPRTPALSKRPMTFVPHDNNDVTSVQSSNRQSVKRTTTMDNNDMTDSM